MLFSALFFAASLLVPAASPHAAPPQHAAATTQAAPAQKDDITAQLQAVLEKADGEPGAQIRGLEAFLRRHPHPPGASQIYQLLIQDATALNDSRRVLLYNEKLQELHPNDLGQRIKVLNLLLLDTSPAAMARAQQDALTLAALADEQAASTPPKEVSAAAWRVDMNRLKAIAQMFLGAVAQQRGDNIDAAKYFRASLSLEPTEEAAAHLGTVLEREGNTAAAVRADALALALPGQTIAERRTLRDQAGSLYARLHHGSQRGFGDLILAQFDVIAAANARQQSELHPYAARNRNAQSLEQFVLTGLDGQPRRLSAERGKVVVLDFWATWCEPCQAEHPAFASLQKKYAAQKNIRFIEINTDDDYAQVPAFLTAHHWGPNTWLDAGLADYLGIDSLPTTVVLAPDGRMVFRESGFDPGTFAPDVERAIAYAQTRTKPASARSQASPRA